MNELLLSLHVIAAILLVGPATVATSLFPRYARQAVRAGAGEFGAGKPGPTGASTHPSVSDVAAARAGAAVLHRVSRVYGRIALLVPVLGIATAVSMQVIGDAWVLVSLSLTLLAAVLLGAAVLPAQAAVMQWISGGAAGDGTLPAAGDAADHGAATAHRATGAAPPSAEFQVRATRSLAMLSGFFALLWVIVVILMIVRPGSSAMPGSVGYH